MKNLMKKGNTIFFKNAPRITSYAAICGSKEKIGVIGEFADITLDDDMYGETTYEKAECKMLANAIALAIEKGGYKEDDIDVLLSGDLLNQIISASFAARKFNFPFLGVYNACSTMSESMMLGAMMADAGYVKRAVAATGSHFASAERQYRYPLELGCTRPPQSQWTVTGAGGCVISSDGDGVKIRRNRRKQYGRGNGSRGGGYDYTASERYGNPSYGLRYDFNGRFGRARKPYSKRFDLGKGFRHILSSRRLRRNNL